MFDDNLIQKSTQVARDNWAKWHDVFEHAGPICDTPLLADRKRFASFCREYSVGRTIRHGTQNEFRLMLGNSPEFLGAIHDDTGHALDKLEVQLRPHFGTRNGTRRITSVLSKVAAFVRPERFAAWDKYAKKGLSALIGRKPSARSKLTLNILWHSITLWTASPDNRSETTW